MVKFIVRLYRVWVVVVKDIVFVWRIVFEVLFKIVNVMVLIVKKYIKV